MVDFFLNGQLVTSPLEWRSIKIVVNFEESIQPNISTSELTFGFDGCKVLDDWIANNGYFRGCPLEIKKDNFVVFDGYVDFKTRYIKLHQGKVSVAVKKKEGLNQLDDQINGTTFGLLNANQNLQFIDVPYIVERKETLIELAIVNVTTFILLKELYESVLRLGTSAKNLTVAVSTAVLDPGLLLQATLQFLLDLAYTVALFLALKDAITNLINSLLPPIRKHKSFYLREAWSKFALENNYNGFASGISEVNGNAIYFPSKQDDKKSTGIPNVLDYGYNFSEFTELCSTAFNANVSIDNNVIQLRSKNDPYFVKNSTFKAKDVLNETEQYNLEDIKGTRIVNFLTDVNDEWTIENFTGTAYEIQTKSTGGNGVSLVNGFERNQINACLGNRKDGLSALESALLALAKLADKVIKTLGGNSNLASKIENRVGLLKVSQNNWSQPKFLLLNDQLKLDLNHRNVWSAKVLYNKYHSYKSFVLNNYVDQKRVVNGLDIPFCLEDFKILTNNSYFTTETNKIGKFVNIEFDLDGNYSTADYWIREPYDKNLIESYVEP